MKLCSHDSHAVFEKIIGPLRDVARSKGYALAVHGTLIRDIDLIAVPWTREACPAHELAEAIGRKAEEVNGIAFVLEFECGDYHRAGAPGSKPHGRLGWTFHLGGGPYIDLAVMPRTDEFDMAAYQRAGGNDTAPKISTHWREQWARPKQAES